MHKNLKNNVALVTGGSRGVGKGIALALAEQGATVYVTGRSQQQGDSSLPGTIFATEKEINQRGGQGIAVVCDHSNDKQVEELFEKIYAQQGRLDLLVNNACAMPESLTQAGSFWEKSLAALDLWDVGLRSSYVASRLAAQIMVPQKSGLIINISAFGGRCYVHGPAYGAGKAAVDKLAMDMAVELKPFQVAAVSLWLGVVRTERTQRLIDTEPEKYSALDGGCESQEFAGRVIAALMQDKNQLAHTGQVLVAAELAQDYGIVDIDGRQPESLRPMLGGPAQANPAVIQ